MARLLVALVALVILCPRPCPALGRDGGPAIAAGLEVGVHGLLAGIAGERRGEPFWQGFRRGALAGAVLHAGAEVASASDRTPALLGGRLAHSLGASLMNDALAGDPLLSSYRLPIGPLLVEWRRGRPLRAGLQPIATLALASALAQGHGFDGGTSLRLLTPVLRDRHVTDSSYTVANVIVLAREVSPDRVLRHELAHVLQYQRGLAYRPLLDPLLHETWLGRVEARLHLRVDADLLLPLSLPLAEVEAFHATLGARSESELMEANGDARGPRP